MISEKELSEIKLNLKKVTAFCNLFCLKRVLYTKGNKEDIMKGILKLIGIALCVVMTVCTVSVTAFAAAAKEVAPVSDSTVTNTGDSVQKIRLKLALPESGTLKFFVTKTGTDMSSVLTLYNSKGKVLKSGKLSELVCKSIAISSKGTYYLDIKLAAKKSVNKLCYVFTGKSSEKYTLDTLDLSPDKTVDLTSYALEGSKDMGDRIKWTSTNSSVVKILKNGKIKTVGEGKATVRAYGSGGGLVTINISVSSKFRPAVSENTFLAGFDEDVTDDEIKALCKKYSLTVVYDYSFSNMFAFKLSESLGYDDMMTFLEKFSKEKGVIYAEPDHIIYIDDPIESQGIVLM